MFHLDHLSLGVRDLDAGVRRVREETGLACYDGGVIAGVIASVIFPLGGDAYLEVESVTIPEEKQPEEIAWFGRTAGCSGACAPTRWRR